MMSLSPERVDRLGRHLAELRRARAMMSFPPGTEPLLREDAYRVQHRLRALLDGGKHMAACKVSGLKKNGGIGDLGVRGPFFASLPHNSIHSSGAVVTPAYPRFGAECELALRLGRASDGAPVVRGAMVAFELVEKRYDSFAKAPLELLVADGLSTAGAVLGPERPTLPEPIEACGVRVFVNGLRILEGRVGDYIGNPKLALRAFLDAAPAVGFDIEEDLILLTGNLLGQVYLSPGDHVCAEVDGFDPVLATFASPSPDRGAS